MWFGARWSDRGRELPSNDGKATGPPRAVCVPADLAATSPTRSVRMVVSRVVMAGPFGLPLLPVPKSTLRKQSQPWLAIYGGSHLLLYPIQQVVRPRTDAPQYCVGPPPPSAL